MDGYILFSHVFVNIGSLDLHKFFLQGSVEILKHRAVQRFDFDTSFI